MASHNHISVFSSVAANSWDISFDVILGTMTVSLKCDDSCAVQPGSRLWHLNGDFEAGIYIGENEMFSAIQQGSRFISKKEKWLHLDPKSWKMSRCQIWSDQTGREFCYDNRFILYMYSKRYNIQASILESFMQYLLIKHNF